MMMGISNRLNKLRGVFFGGRRGSASPDNNSGGSGGREHGFTLIEVLIALSLTAILMAGVYSLYNTFYKRSACQDDMLGAQQNARAALQLMQKEIILAGHRVPTTTGGPLPVEAGANAASVTFRYMEALKDLNDPDRAAIRYLITYSASGDSLMRRQCETDPADSANWELCLDSTGDSYAIISGLDTSDATGGLEFKYYGADGAEVIGPINDEATLRDLRYIEIFIKTTVDTICGTKTVEAKTRVNLRNLSVDAAEPDPTPPNTPTGLQVREVTNGARVGGTCGELNVRWNAPATNVDTDINYYSISYTEDGGGSGNMRVFVRDLIDDDTTNGILDESDSKYYYTLAPGTNPADNLLYLKHYSSDGGTTDNNKYTIKIVAVDLDGNVSDVTSVATTNTTYETATNSDFGVDVDDTVINPAKPFPVSITSALPDEATNNITITWDNPAENTDVIGFNIYRSTAPFPDIDVDAVNPLATMNAPITAVGTVELVASPYGGEGQKAVGAGSTSFTDSALIGCQTYYYAIIPKTCDATLIDKRTDAPADTDSSRQWAVATDYAVVYGDGIGDAVINITDYPDFNLSNTTPGDTELPPNPQIDYAAGWKRIFLTITNPSLEEAPDFAHSVVYVQSGAECPSIDELTGQVDTDSVLLPNSNTDAFGGIDFEPGIFTGHDTVSPAYTTHAVMCDSLSNAECITPAVNPSPLSPALLNDTQYCYLGISYDTCGNANSTIGVVTTQATMCGDEPGGAPGNGGSLDLSIWPDVDTDISVSGCSSKFNVSFGGMNHVFDQGYYDIASYTIHAKSGNASFGTPEDSTAVDMVNASLTAAGFIHTSNDFSVHTNGLPYIEGELYSFGVSGLDCIYRNIEPDNVDYVYATIKANNYSGWLSISDISPGSIDRDIKCEDPLYDAVGDIYGTSCDIPNDATDEGKHREVLTGVTIQPDGSADPTSALAPHNTVTMFLNNTSAGTFTVNKASVSWMNSEAILTGVTIGGGRSTVGAVTTSIATTPIAAIAPFTKMASGVSLSAVTLDAIARYVPITFEFENSDGEPIDMRGDALYIQLFSSNDTTTSTECTSALTVSGVLEEDGIPVPLGPVASGTTMQPLSWSAIGSVAVPGDSGDNTVAINAVEIKAMLPVTITSNVASGSFDAAGNPIAISSARVFYALTDDTATEAPSDIASYTEIDMTKDGVALCGDLTAGSCSGTIEPQDGNLVWYFILLEDEDGNFSRDPEPAIIDGVVTNNTYVYKQKGFDACDFTPAQPENFGGSFVDGSAEFDYDDTVSLFWDPVTTYEEGITIHDTDSISYNVNRQVGIRGSSFHQLISGSTGCQSPLTATSCTDNFGVNITYKDNFYEIEAINSCADSPLPSDPTRPVYKELCTGSPEPKLELSKTSIFKNGSFTVYLESCDMAFNDLSDEDFGAVGVSTDSGLDTDIFNMYETNDSGWGKQTLQTSISNEYGIEADIYGVLTSTNGDTIYVSHAPATATSPQSVTVDFDPCDNTPNAPTGLTLTQAPSSSDTYDGTAYKVDLAWTAPTNNTDGSLIQDLVEFDIYRAYSSDDGDNWSWDSASAATVSATTLELIGLVNSGVAGIGDFDRLKFRINASDSCGTPEVSAYSAETNEVVIGACTNPPLEPADLTLSRDDGGNLADIEGDGFIKFNWTAAGERDFESYKVYISQSTDSGATWSASTEIADVTDVNATSYTYDTNADATNTRYRFEVRSVDSCGNESAASGTSTTGTVVKDTCDATPTTPANFTFTNVPDNDIDASGNLNFSWDALTDGDITSITLWDSIDGGGTWSDIGTISADAATATIANGRLAGEVVSYQITTLDFCGDSSTGATLLNQITVGICSVPATPVLADPPVFYGDGTIDLSWLQVYGTSNYLTGYEVYEDLDGSGTYAPISGAGALDDTATDPMGYTVAAKSHANTTYEYKVLAYQDFCAVRQYSLDSNIVLVDDTQACLYTPDKLTLFDYTHTDLGGNSTPPLSDNISAVGLTWGLINGANNPDLDGYKIYQDIGSGFNLVTQEAALTNTYTVDLTSTVPAPVSGDTLNYQIAAIDTCDPADGGPYEGEPLEVPATLIKGLCDVPLLDLGDPFLISASVSPSATIGDGDVTLTWNQPGDDAYLSGYYVERQLNTDGWVTLNPAAILAPGTLTYSITEAGPTTDVFHYQVRAVNEFCTLEPPVTLPPTLYTDVADINNFDACLYVPVAPTDLAYNYTDNGGSDNPPTADLDGEVFLSWTTPDLVVYDDIVEYRIYQSVDGGAYNQIGVTANATVTTHTVTTSDAALAGKTLSYKITSADSCADVVGGNETTLADADETATTIVQGTCDIPAVSAPSAAIATNGSGEILITWPQVSGTSTHLTGYKLYESIDSGTSWTQLGADLLVAELSYTTSDRAHTALAQDGTYTYKIEAFQTVCAGTVTDPVLSEADTLLSPISDGAACLYTPDVPLTFTYNYTDDGGNYPPLSDKSDNTVDLTWTVPVNFATEHPDVTKFNVYESTDGVTYTDIADIAGLATTTYTVNVAAHPTGTSLSYKIDAEDNCPLIGAQTAATDTINRDYCDVPTDPAAVTATIVGGDGRIVIAWDDPADVFIDGYKVYESYDDGTSWNAIELIDIADRATVSYTTTDRAYAALGATETGYKYKVVSYQSGRCGGALTSPGAVLSANILESESCLYTPEDVADFAYNFTDRGGNFSPTRADLDGDVGFSWTALDTDRNPDISGYNIYQDSGLGYSLVAGPVAASTYTYNVSAIANDATLNYQIAAIDNCATAPGPYESTTPSTIASTLTKGLCDRPLEGGTAFDVSMVITAGAGTVDVKLDWTEPADADGDHLSGYYVDRKVGAAGAWAAQNGGVMIAKGAPRTLTISEAGPTVDTFYYRVRAVNELCTPLVLPVAEYPTTLSSELLLDNSGTCLYIPENPGSLSYNYTDNGLTATPTADLNDQSIIEWTLPPATTDDIKQYNIYESVSGGAYAQIDFVLVGTTTYTVNTSAHAPSTELSYKVTVEDNCATPLESDLGATTATTSIFKGTCDYPEAPTPAVAVTDFAGRGNGLIEITWTQPTATFHDGYKIYESENGAAYNPLTPDPNLTDSTTVTHTTTDRNHNAGSGVGTYKYKVEAYHDQCNGGAITLTNQTLVETNTINDSDACLYTPDTPLGFGYDYTDAGGNATPAAESATDTIVLSWTTLTDPPNGDIGEYKLYEDKNESGIYTYMGLGIGPAVTTYTIDVSADTAGTRYSYKLSAIDNCATQIEGLQTAETSLITKDSCDSPLTPTIATVVPTGGDGTITITWAQVGGTSAHLDGYRLYESIDGVAGAYLPLASGGALDDTTTSPMVYVTSDRAHGALLGDGTYTYKVEAYQTTCAGVEQTSTHISTPLAEVEACLYTPTEPLNLAYSYTDAGTNSNPPKADLSEGVKITWNEPITDADGDIDGYNIYISNDGIAGTYFAGTASVGSTIWTEPVGTYDDGTEFFFKVLAYDTCAAQYESPLSVATPTSVFKGLCDTPLDFVLNAPTLSGDGTIVLDWTQPGTANERFYLSGYTIFESTNGGGLWSNIATVGAATTTHMVIKGDKTSLLTYDYQIRAENNNCQPLSQTKLSNSVSVDNIDACLYTPTEVTGLAYDYADWGNYSPPNSDDFGSVHLSWTPLGTTSDPDVVNYNIYDVRDGYSVLVDTVAGITSTNITVDVNGIATADMTTLNYKVAAEDDCAVGAGPYVSPLAVTATSDIVKGLCDVPLDNTFDVTMATTAGAGTVDVKLTWNNAPGDTTRLTGFYVDRQVNGVVDADWTDESGLLGAGTLTYTITETRDGTGDTYYYRVRAANNDCPLKNPLSIAKGDQPTRYSVSTPWINNSDVCMYIPESPVSVSYNYTDSGDSSAPPTADLNNEVVLTWTIPPLTTTDIAGYNIYESTDGGTSYTLHGSVGSSSLTYTANTDTFGTDGDQLRYTVTTVDTCGPGLETDIVDGAETATSVIKGSCDIPQTPVPGVVIAANGTGTLKVSWPQIGVASTHLDGYKVYESIDGAAGTYIEIASGGALNDTLSDPMDYVTTDRSHSADPPAGNDTYTYKVEAYQTSCAGPTVPLTLSAATGTIADSAACLYTPETVTGFGYNYTDAGGNTPPEAEDGSDNVLFTWTTLPDPPDGDISSYKIFQTKDGIESLIPVFTSADGTATTATVSVLGDLAGSEYTYTIAAADSCLIEGVKTAPTSLITKDSCDAPITPTVTSVLPTGGDGTITIEWNQIVASSPYVSGYRVYEASFDGAIWSAPALTATVTDLVTTPSLSWTSGTKTPGAKVSYRYTVEAYQTSCGGVEQATADTSATILADTDFCLYTPATPTLLNYTYQDNGGTATPIADLNGGVGLSWTAPVAGGGKDGEVATYQVYQEIDGVGGYSTVGLPVAGLSVTIDTSDVALVGKTLSYKVLAIDGCGTPYSSIQSTATSLITKGICDIPTLPTGAVVSIAVNGSGTLKVEWDQIDSSSTYLSGYRVYESIDNGGAWNAAASYTTTDTATDPLSYTTGVKTGTGAEEYKYRIESYQGNCGAVELTSAYAETAGTILDTDFCLYTPTKPTALTYNYTDSGGSATPVADLNDTVDLTWAIPAGVSDVDIAGYKIYQTVNGTSSVFATVAGGTSTTHTVSTAALSDNDLLSYTVSAYDSCAPTAIEGAEADTTTDITKGLCDIPVTPVPTLEIAVDGTGTLKVSWPQVAGSTHLTGYKIYYSGDDGGTWEAEPVSTINDLVSPTVSEVSPDMAHGGTGYVFQVESYQTDCTGPTAPSSRSGSTITVYDSDACLYTPEDVTGVIYNYTDAGGSGPTDPTADLNDQVVLNWTDLTAPDNADVAKYNIYQSTDGVDYSTLVASTADSTFTTHTLNVSAEATGATLSYKVLGIDDCVNGAIESSDSNATASVVKDSCDAPTTPAVASVVATGGDGTIAVNWNQVAGSAYLDGYRVYESIDNGGSWSAAVHTTTDLATDPLTWTTPVKAALADPNTAIYKYKVEAYQTTCGGTEQTSNGISAGSVDEDDVCLYAPTEPTALFYDYTDNGLTATPLADLNDTVTLSWTAPITGADDDIDDYNIYQKVGAGSYNLIGTSAGLTTTTVDTSSASTGDTLSYAVTAVDNCGVGSGPYESAQSTATSDINKDLCDTPLDDAGYTLTDPPVFNGDGTITLNWNIPAVDTTYLSGFHIEERINADPWTTLNPGLAILPKGDITYEITKADPTLGDTYRYRVRAANKFCATWQMNNTNVDVVANSEACLYTPTEPLNLTYNYLDNGLTATPIADLDDTVILSWDAPVVSTDIATYQVYQDINGAGYLPIDTTAGLSITIDTSAITDNDTLSYTVSAIDSCGVGTGPYEGAQSTATSVINKGICDLPDDPGAVTATADFTDKGQGFINITWTTPAATYLDGFEIYEDEGLGYLPEADVASPTATTYTTGDQAHIAASYQYQVDAYHDMCGATRLRNLTAQETAVIDDTDACLYSPDSTLLSYTIDGSSTAALSWFSVINADLDKYTLYIDDGTTVSTIDVSPPTVTYTTGILSRSIAPITYDISIDVVDTCGNATAGFAPVSLLSTDECLHTPLAPTSFDFTHSDQFGNFPPFDAAADGSISLGWTAPADPDVVDYWLIPQYTWDNVTWFDDGSGGVNTFGATTYTLANASGNLFNWWFQNAYRYEIVAVDSCAAGPYISPSATTGSVYAMSCDSNNFGSAWMQYNYNDDMFNLPPLDVETGTENIVLNWTNELYDGGLLCGNIAVDGYNIYENLDDAGLAIKESVYQPATTGCWTGGDQYTIDTVGDALGTTYSYQVITASVCKDGAGDPVESAWANAELTTVTKGVCSVASDVPTNLTIDNFPVDKLNASGEVDLSWDAALFAGQYDIWGYDSADNVIWNGPWWWGTVTDASATLDLSAAPTPTYFKFEVTSTNTCNWLTSLPSTVSTVVDNDCSYAAPATISLGNAPNAQAVDAAGDINISWAVVAGASTYNVYRNVSTDAGATWGGWALEANVVATSYSDPVGLANPAETHYKYAVSGVDAVLIEGCTSDATPDVVQEPCGDGAPDEPSLQFAICGAFERTADFPLAALGDITSIEVYECPLPWGGECFEAAAGDSSIFLGTVDVPSSHNRGGDDFGFDIPLPNSGCGAFFAIKSVDACGQASTLSNAP